MPQDQYFGDKVSLSDPSNEAIPITPGEPLDEVSRAIYVGTAGDAWLKLGDMNSFVCFKNLSVGEHPLRVLEARVAGTTAADMLALY